MPSSLRSKSARIVGFVCLCAGAVAAVSGCGSGTTVTTTGGGGGGGTTYAATLTLSASSLTFPSTISGLASPAQTLTLTNSGSVAVTLTSIATSGDYSQQSFGCTGMTLAVNATCQIQVIFNPTATGARAGALSVASNPAAAPVSVPLSGTATAAVPILSLSASTIGFGTVTTGLSSAPYMVTATNLGSAALNLSNVAISGDFTQTSSGCGTSLAPTGTCQIAVTFTPTAAGARTGTLAVTNNAAASPQTVSLTGTGGAAATFAGSSLQLTVLAGSRPVTGAAVQMYAAGMTGNGSAATALGSVLTTNASGVVIVPAGYVCPAPGSMVYAVSRGGTVQGVTSANANLVMMLAVGACNGIASGTTNVIDEATTVAAVYALAPFYSVGGIVGATASNGAGIANAFAMAATLADPAAGTSPGATLPANAHSPAPRVNSIANMVDACAMAVSSCASLYAAAPLGTALATNTLDAVYYLARNPAGKVAAAYAQSLASSAYAPVLTASPLDWTMFVTYSGGGMNSPTGIGVDSKGNLWVANYFNVASKFSPVGAPVFANGIGGDGLNNSYGLAVDLSDNAWIPNEQPFTSTGIGTVTELTPSGGSVTGSPYANGGLNYPLAVAIDPNGTVWVVDYGDSYVTLLNPSGAPVSGANGYTTPLFAFPVAVAVDANHYGWIVNASSNSLTKVAPDGSTFTNYSCCELASGIAIDQGDNLWVADYFGDSISLVKNSGVVVSSGYTAGGSIYHPQGIAIDGAGTVWVANYRAAYLTELAGSTAATPGAALSPATGLGGDAQLLEAYALAADASGSLWVSNFGNNTITKFVGLVVPVKTPLSGLPQLP